MLSKLSIIRKLVNALIFRKIPRENGKRLGELKRIGRRAKPQ